MSDKRNKRKQRGAQAGNANARTHGFYAGLDPLELAACGDIARRDGRDPRMVAVHTRLEQAFRQDPANTRVFRDAARLITRYYSRQDGLDAEQTADLRRVVRAALDVVRECYLERYGFSRDRAGFLLKRIKLLEVLKSVGYFSDKTNGACQAQKNDGTDPA